MAYSSSSLPEVEHSSSLYSFLAFKAIDLLSPLALTISKSFLMIISWTLRFPISSSRDSDVKYDHMMIKDGSRMASMEDGDDVNDKLSFGAKVQCDKSNVQSKA
ncbi:hypothetical protein Tco_0703205 [Tanacetum coccineum]|uniref:Uncharacterized protein n=1 Tax=Tanacetum coccineum TaxID=301880 RepID=A0ABQ4XYB3_9ASTR